LRSHRRISDELKAEIVEMESSGVRKHKIMDILEMRYGGYDKVGCTTRDLYNFCHRYKAKTIAAGDTQTVISYLTELQRRDPDFFFEYMVDGEGHLKGLFWCDSQCLLDYEAFGDVVVFDSTYKTNRYNLPLVPFVGVNHHRSTVIFGCGIISHENIESYVWMLRTFSEAMIQKHPVSVITDGDLAMQRAIRLVWPNSSHRLCIWHIEQNIVRNVKDDVVKDEFRSFLYDCWPIEETETKWLQFLDKHKVTNKESWLYQMYDTREIWCASYHAGKCYLGLRSNQRSESLNSRIHMRLDRKMTLLDMVRHVDHCLSGLRANEAKLDTDALQSEVCTDPDASIIELEAVKSFTPTVFAMVQFSIKAAKKCFLIEIEDGDNMSEYIVGRKDKGDMMYFVKCEFCDEGNLKEISCSCRKLQSIGTPCSHIFFVLGHRHEDKLPDCCVLKRWTMGAKNAFPPNRNSTMYDYSDSLQRYRELRNISHAASFAASRSSESYERLKRVLEDEAAMNLPNGGDNGSKRYGPVLPQAPDVDSIAFSNVLDPLHVPGRGAPKKNLKSISNNKKTKVKCSLCKGEGHNRRTCSMRKEVVHLS
jgi:zinc finger SWIM domain-containing protein 3